MQYTILESHGPLHNQLTIRNIPRFSYIKSMPSAFNAANLRLNTFSSLMRCIFKLKKNTFRLVKNSKTKESLIKEFILLSRQKLYRLNLKVRSCMEYQIMNMLKQND